MSKKVHNHARCNEVANPESKTLNIVFNFAEKALLLTHED